MASVDFNRIASNIAALNSLNSLRSINTKLGVAQTRLATGKRINEAADDPAGLSIATKLNARSEGMKVALNNIGDAKNLLAVAEGGLSKMSDILIQIRSKAEQAASDTLGSTERSAIKQEIQSLAEQLQNIVDETKFNGVKLLDGTVNKRFQTGTEDGEYTSFTLTQAHDPTTLGVSSKNLAASITNTTFSASITAAALSSAFTGQSVLDTGGYTVTVLDKATAAGVGKSIATSSLPSNISGVGEEAPSAPEDELSYNATTTASSGGNFKVVVDAYTAATANAAGSIDYTVYDSNGSQLFTVDGRAVAAGSGAIAISLGQTAGGNNSGATLTIANRQASVAAGSAVEFEYIAQGKVKLKVADASGSAMTIDKDGSSATTATGTVGYFAAGGAADVGRGVSVTLAAIGAVTAGQSASLTYNEQGNFIVNVGTASAASSYMTTVDNVINTVNRSMASLGALTARMSAKEETLATAQVNTEAAYNRIMNADMAAEQVNATKFGILQQTALAMLAQVNTGPQAILSLFR
ncbi:MAG: flagellin [Candidatus Methylomirabilales bacterium]